jgi:hypothetical protein
VTPDLRPVRVVAGVQAACGLALALLPDRIARLVCAGRPEPDARVVRVLGIRLVAQQVLVLRAPTRTRVLLCALVDAVHGASMVAVAALWPTYRWAASVSAAHAGAAGLAGVLTAPRTGR